MTLVPAGACADGVLLQQRAHHPLGALVGPPAAASSLVAGSEWQIALGHANVFMGGVAGEERLALDGETTELALAHRRRLGRCWQGELVLPFVVHSGGWADGAIETWHGWFGLPNGSRERAPRFELDYRWIDAEGQERRLQDETAGLGDLRVALQRALRCPAGDAPPRPSSVLRAGIKLPSGDPERLLGSGAADLFADLQWPSLHPAPGYRVGAALGLLLPGESALLGAQRPLALYGSLGLELGPWRGLRLVAQLDAHSPLQDSALEELGQGAASLSAGLRLALGGGRLELSISEDIAVDTAPDIVARIGWSRTVGAAERAAAAR